MEIVIMEMMMMTTTTMMMMMMTFLLTANRFAFEEIVSSSPRFHFFERDVIVDGVVFSRAHAQGSIEALVRSSQHLCSGRSSAKMWRSCRGDEMMSQRADERFPAEKGPDTYGPARLVAESPFFFVVGSHDDCEANERGEQGRGEDER
eukprot:763776-Hanusia_phi.AAC.8